MFVKSNNRRVQLKREGLMCQLVDNACDFIPSLAMGL